ncbi:MAG: hypothetical protein WDM96_10955 [Lacunisphaera sp.]
MNTLAHPASPWTQLQTELRDLAYLLDRKGSHTAADLAVTIAARIDELLANESPRDAKPREPSPES